jgi:hypothetical protein
MAPARMYVSRQRSRVPPLRTQRAAVAVMRNRVLISKTKLTRCRCAPHLNLGCLASL